MCGNPGYKSAIETEEKLKASGEVVDNLNDSAKKNIIICHDYEGNEYEISSNGKPKFNHSNDSIPWANWTWNPVTGCLGECPYCYAREIAEDSQFKGAFPAGFNPLFRHDRLDAPKNTKINIDPERPESKRVFVCSMADLFGHWVPQEWIKKVIEATKKTPELEFLFLTKNPIRYMYHEFPDNFWLGVTVDAQSKVDQAIDVLRFIDFCGVRWLSFEPFLEPIDLESIESGFAGIDWIVIGAQSSTRQSDGTMVNSFAPKFEWVMDLVAQAKSVGCAVYMKQNLLGRVSSQYPGMQLIQEYPTVYAD
jgi:protein gp37